MATQAPSELETEYRAMRETVGLLDRSERGKLDVLGPEAVDYLQGQVTNDVEVLEPGQGCYAALLSPKGKILADVRVLRRVDELWLDTERGALEAALRDLNMYKIGRQVEIADRTAERGILSLIGPRAGEAAGASVPQAEHAFVEAGIGSAEALAVRTDLGVDVILPAEHAEEARSVLTKRGAAALTERAAEMLRIESGRPRYGLDISDDNLPGEVGIEERAVSFTKGCYVGQEPVARMHYRGHPNRYLRGLKLSSPASGGQPVFLDGKVVGSLTSACVSPSLGPIALAIVRREVDVGESVLVGEEGSRAHVVELPFEGPAGG